MAILVHAVIERDLQTGILVGSVPGLAGAHTQGRSIEEVRENLREALVLLREQYQLQLHSEFIGTTVVHVS